MFDVEKLYNMRRPHLDKTILKNQCFNTFNMFFFLIPDVKRA